MCTMVILVHGIEMKVNAVLYIAKPKYGGMGIMSSLRTKVTL